MRVVGESLWMRHLPSRFVKPYSYFIFTTIIIIIWLLLFSNNNDCNWINLREIDLNMRYCIDWAHSYDCLRTLVNVRVTFALELVINNINNYFIHDFLQYIHIIYHKDTLYRHNCLSCESSSVRPFLIVLLHTTSIYFHLSSSYRRNLMPLSLFWIKSLHIVFKCKTTSTVFLIIII